MPNVFIDCVAEGNGGDGFKIESAGSEGAGTFVSCRATGNGGQGFNFIKLVGRDVDIDTVRAFLDVDRDTLSNPQLERAVEIARSAPEPATYHSLVEFLAFLGSVETASGIAKKLLNLIWS